jgi:hypothetical protein
MTRNKDLLKDGFNPPKHDVGFNKYKHERACADVYVACRHAGGIIQWDPHKRLSRGFIPDRAALYEDGWIYIEVEMGKKDRIPGKLQNYQNYYRETHEEFRVLFLVQQLREWPTSPHYRFQLLSDFLQKNLPDNVPNSAPDDRNNLSS